MVSIFSSNYHKQSEKVNFLISQTIAFTYFFKYKIDSVLNLKTLGSANLVVLHTFYFQLLRYSMAKL